MAEESNAPTAEEIAATEAAAALAATEAAALLAADRERAFEPFSEKQQTKVNDLVNQTFGRAYTKAKAEAKQEADAALAALQAKLDAATAAAIKPAVEEKPAKAKKDDSPEFLALQSQLSEFQTASKTLKDERDSLRAKLESQTTQTTETRIKEAFISAASKIDFYDPMDVFALVRSDIVIDQDTGKVIVRNAGGQPKLNSDLEPMTLTEFLGEFAKQKAHLVKAKNLEGGTGAGQSRVEKPEKPKTAKDYSSMSQEDFAALTSKVMANQ